MDDMELRYKRHFSLPGFTHASQLALRRAKVLVAGCGGLGHPVLQYLTATGVGYIGIADHDEVQHSNLHRQILFGEFDIGRPKLEAAVLALRALNSETEFELYNTFIDQENAAAIISAYDLVIDCTDNFGTRYLLDQICGTFKKPLIHGSVYRYEGRVTLLHGRSATGYTDIYPEQPLADEIPDCASGGVLGPIAGIIGNLMATEAIKWITQIGRCLDGRMLIVDALRMEFFTVKIQTPTETQAKEQPTKQNHVDMIREMDAKEFEALKQSGKKFTLIDVRETSEFEEFNLGGILIPLGQIPARFEEIPRDHDVVVHCRSGMRSAQAIGYLQQQHGFDNLINLKRGILDFV